MIAKSALRKLAAGPSLEELNKKVLDGEYQYHNFGRCFVITHIVQYKNERVLEVVILFGEGFLEKREEITNHLVAFGKKNECAAIEATCRPGLQPVMKPFGWKRRKVVLRKAL